MHVVKTLLKHNINKVKSSFLAIKIAPFGNNCFSQKLEICMKDISSENLSLINRSFQSLQEFEVD